MAIGEVDGPFGVPVPDREAASELRHETLNLFDSTAVAVSSVAPAYSLAATMGLLFATPGVAYAGPSVIILSFIPVLFIAVAYFHLNRKDPDCGASYSWLAKLVTPFAGWFNGWVQICTSVLFCVSAPVLAGITTMYLFNQLHWVSYATSQSVGWTAFAGAIWLLFVAFICIWGIRWTTNFQWIMVIIEYVCVVVFSVWAIVRVWIDHPAHSMGMHWSWFNPFSLTGFSALSAGIVLGVFFFWGWDTSVNLNEESKQATHNPGRAGVISMFLLLVVFLINIVAAQMTLTPDQIQNSGSNILFLFAQVSLGGWAKYLMIIAVLSSTVGTTQTTLLPAARITLSMSRDRVFPKVFSYIHGQRKTPAIGTAILAGICLLGIVATAKSPTVSTYFTELINNIGVLIAFYYGATGLTCAWAYRKVAFTSVKFFFTGVLLPGFSGAILLAVAYDVWHLASQADQAWPITISLILGIPAAAWAMQHRANVAFRAAFRSMLPTEQSAFTELMANDDYFTFKSVAYDSID